MEEIDCTNCKLVKGVSEFRKRESLKRGYQSWCKECEREANSLGEAEKEVFKLYKKDHPMEYYVKSIENGGFIAEELED